MKKLLSVVTCFSLMFFNCNPIMAKVVKVPANTNIFIMPNDTITSKDMSIDTINANIIDDVVVNNTVIFKSGAKATLHIGEIEKARCWGKPGKLVISNGYAYDRNGDKHRIIVSKSYYGEERGWTKAVGVVSIFFLWPLALFGFVHGGQATVSSSAVIETTLSSSYDFAF